MTCATRGTSNWLGGRAVAQEHECARPRKIPVARHQVCGGESHRAQFVERLAAEVHALGDVGFGMHAARWSRRPRRAPRVRAARVPPRPSRDAAPGPPRARKTARQARVHGPTAQSQMRASAGGPRRARPRFDDAVTHDHRRVVHHDARRRHDAGVHERVNTRRALGRLRCRRNGERNTRGECSRFRDDICRATAARRGRRGRDASR